MDVFKDGCIIVEKGNTVQLAENTGKLLESDNLIKKYSKKAFGSSKNFTLKKEAQKIMEVYEKVI